MVIRLVSKKLANKPLKKAAKKALKKLKKAKKTKPPRRSALKKIAYNPVKIGEHQCQMKKYGEGGMKEMQNGKIQYYEKLKEA